MIRIFLFNVADILKSILSVKIYWKTNSIEANNCLIDESTRLIEPYNLSNIHVGFGTYISENARVSETIIGRFCSIGPNLICGWGIHPLNGISTHPAFYSSKKQSGFTFSKVDKVNEREKIVIGNDVFIGANVIILDGIKIGDGAVIGAGTVVSKNVPPYAIVIGCPMKIIKYRFEEDVIEKLLKIKWWDKDNKALEIVENLFFDVNAFIEYMERNYDE